MKKIVTGLLFSWLAGGLYAQMPAGQYNIKFTVIINDPTGNNSGRCKNDFHIYLQDGGNPWWDAFYQPNGIGSATSLLVKIDNIAASQYPSQIYATGSRNWHRTIGGCNGYDDSPGPVQAFPATPCTMQTYYNIIPNWASTMMVQAIPASVVIQAAGNPATVFLSDADPLTLEATTGFDPSVYRWQYSVDQVTWTDFPPQFQGNSTVTFTGAQLMQGEANFLPNIGKNTFFRIFYSCGAHQSNMLTIENLLSAPHITSVTPIFNRCYGDTTGSFTVTFDRALLADEELNLTVTGPGFNPSQSNISLDGSNSYTYPVGVIAGQYSIALNGRYPTTMQPNPPVTYTDGSGQSATFTIGQPDPVLYSANKQHDVYCYGGSDGLIVFNASGGVGPYTFGYQGPGQTSFDWTQTPGGSFTSSASLAGLSPGDYQLLVADSHGCLQKDVNHNPVVTSVTINQPAAPVQLDFYKVLNPLAYGSTDGQVTAVVKGGTPATGGSYGINWTDSLGNIVNTVSSSVVSSGYQTVLNNGGNGHYILQATDANYSLASPGQQQGCIVQNTFTLAQPPPMEVNIEQTRRVTCHGYATAQLEAHGSGGIEIPGVRYHYQWTVQSSGSQTPVGSDDSVLSQLAAGYYQVTITDNNNISRASSLFLVAEPDVLAASIATTPLACNGDSTGIATPTVTGGTRPYQYNWSTGDTTAIITHLTEGGYFLFVTDSNACQTQQSASVTAPGGLVIDTLVTQPTCNLSCDGAIRLNVTGGAGGYVYVWNTGAAGSSLNALCAGRYDVKISDANGCAALRKFALSDPPSLAVDAGQNTTLCTGETYAADATIDDRGAQYQWSGSNGFSASLPRVSLSDPGTYRVLVTDSRGCTGTDSFAISRTDKTISADFLVSTQVFQGQKVTAVNISKPDPDSISWIIPDNPGITVVGKDQQTITLLFSDTGSYSIGMKSWSSPCWKVATQQVVVLQAQPFDNPGTVADPLVQSFNVAPNPSTGSFTVSVVLNSVVNIRIRLFSMLTNSVADDRQLSGGSRYILPYNVGNIAKGGYFLLLETPKGSSVYKIVIL